MFGYTTVYDKSMNGVKTLSDGKSIISNGVASHENIVYTNYVKSEDELTSLTNDSLTTQTVNSTEIDCATLTANTANSTALNTLHFTVHDSLGNSLLDVDGSNELMTIDVFTEMNNALKVIDNNIQQTQSSTLQQTGTGSNLLKDTTINGYLNVSSNIVQSGGNCTLKDVTCGNITMTSNKSITQTGSSVSNTLGQTSIDNLIVTSSITLPPLVTISGTITNDDILMTDDSVILQDTTFATSKINVLRATKATGLTIDGDLDMIQSGSTATLKNTIVEGTCEIQGDITQTAGATVLNTILCNNITLRDDNDINLAGTGKINQVGTGTNSMNAITLNSNQNLTFNGTGIISQPLNATNILSHFRTAGFGIVSGRNNSSPYSHTANIPNNNALHFQYNRDNTNGHSYLITNKSTSGGAFRFQRYTGAVYTDEPMVIGDTIDINKNVQIIGSSLTAASATLGIVSQSEIDCLNNLTTNIKDKFDSLDSQIAALDSTGSSLSTATTGITYNSGTDTTNVDNNLTISTGKSFVLGTTNVGTFISTTNTNMTDYGNKLTGFSYNTGTDTTTIDNNVTITGGKTLIVDGLDITTEIRALDTSFTTGTLNAVNSTIQNLTYTNLSTSTGVDGHISTSNGRTLYINDSKTSGDLVINSASTSSNVQIANGNLTMSNGDILLGSNDLISTSLVQTNNLKLTSFTGCSFGTNMENTVDTYTNPKTAFVLSSCVAKSITLNAMFNKMVTINIPISVSASGTLTASGTCQMYITEIISAMTVTIKKDGGIFSTTSSVSYTTTFPTQKQFRVDWVLGGTSFNYEQHMFNVQVTFQPTFENAMHTYTIELGCTSSRSIAYSMAPGISASQSSSQTIYANSLVSDSATTNATALDATISGYNLSHSISFVYDSIQWSSKPGGLWLNDVISNNMYNQNTIQTNVMNASESTVTNQAVTNLTSSNNNLTHISSPNYPIVQQFVPVYMLDGSRVAGYNWWPITCSQYHLRSPDSDDLWVIHPGYKITIYANDGYGGTATHVINYTGTTPFNFEPTTRNSANSVKVFYLSDSNEITNGLVS